jgi:ferredoxin
MPKTITVVHDRSKCIGCRSCVLIAPQNWTILETDGKARLIGSKKKGGENNEVYVGEIFDVDLELNKKAAAACPMKIIKI